MTFIHHIYLQVPRHHRITNDYQKVTKLPSEGQLTLFILN